MLQSSLRWIIMLINAYAFLLIIRVVLSWLGDNVRYSRIAQMINVYTDPYLRFFDRLPLQIGIFHFGAYVGIMLLQMLTNILEVLYITGSISVSIILISLTQSLLSIIGFLGLALLVVVTVRYVVFLFFSHSTYHLWYSLDRFLQPPIYSIFSKLFRNRIIHYRRALLYSMIIITIVLYGFNYVSLQLLHVLTYISI